MDLAPRRRQERRRGSEPHSRHAGRAATVRRPAVRRPGRAVERGVPVPKRGAPVSTPGAPGRSTRAPGKKLARQA